MRSCILLLLLSLVTFVTAQSPNYIHFGVQDGMPSNLVYCIEQDRNGMIWLATDNGLVRFDGQRFKTYLSSDGLPDPEVLGLHQDIDGRLWVSCFRQKPVYIKDGRIVGEHQDSLLGKIVFNTAICEVFNAPDSSLWFAGHSAVVYHQRGATLKKFKFNRSIMRMGWIGKDMFGLGKGSILHIWPDGRQERLVDLYELYKNEHYYYGGAAACGNNILYAAREGLLLFQWDGSRLHLRDRSPINGGKVFVDRRNRFWVATGAGITCYDNDRQDMSNPVHYLKDKNVFFFFEDRQGNYWFCTTGDGVYMLPKGSGYSFTEKQGLPSNNITALAPAPEGGILAGDEIGNLYRVHDGRIQPISTGSFSGYNRVRGIIPVSAKERWVARDEGLWHETTNGRRSFPGLGNPKGIVLRQGIPWVGSSYKLFSLDIARDTVSIKFNRRITAVAEDSEGNLWAGCIEGLFSEKDGYSINWGSQYPECAARILGLAAGPDNVLYIATPDRGLLKATVKNGAIISLNTSLFKGREGPGVILAIHCQPDGTVWLATHYGVFRLSPKGEIQKYDTYQGLLDNDVNTVTIVGDTLWVGTRSGLCFLPLGIPAVRPDFKTCFVGLHYHLDNTVVEQDLYGIDLNGRAIEVPSKASSIEINLAGLYYRSLGSNRFIVRLKHELLPLHLWTSSNLINWISEWGSNKYGSMVVTQNGSLSFGAHLTPGKYLLDAYAVSADSTISQQSAQIVVLHPPLWYQSLWLWIAIIASLLYLAWRVLQTRLKVRQLDHEVSSLQLKGLQAQINPHFIGNSIHAFQQFFYPPDPIKASDYVAMFTDLLRQTMHFSETSFISLQDEIAYDRRYLELIQLRLGDRFRYEITGVEGLDTTIAFPAMLLQPILENATHHGLATVGISVLSIHFEEQMGRLNCRIRDNGMGINASLSAKAQHNNNHISKGISLLKRIIQTLNQLYPIDIRIHFMDLGKSNPGEHGTQVEISFRILPELITLSPKNTSKSESIHH